MQRWIAYLRNNYYLEILAFFLFLLSFFIEPILGAMNGQGFVFHPVQQIFKGYYEIKYNKKFTTSMWNHERQPVF